MFRRLGIAAFSLALVASGLLAGKAHACPKTPAGSHWMSATVTHGVVYKTVQEVPQYDLRRPEVVSGARVTLFANFLRSEAGIVLFVVEGTSVQCNLVEWKPDCVTVELPKLGLTSPKNAQIQIVLPDGRIAKTFRVLYVSQPDIVVHNDSVPQPMPPAPAAQPAVYATAVQGGLVLQSASEAAE